MSEVIKPSIDTYFNKKYIFDRKNDWTLPSLNKMYREDIWFLEKMVDMKNKLNKAKSLLNDKGVSWQQHTANVNKAGFVMECVKSVIRPEILTQAWCKFSEILSNYSLLSTYNNNFTSVHLCEAPGGFISALNYYIYKNYSEITWDWIGNTLNPYYEGSNMKNICVDDRVIFPTLRNWYFGKDDTGDITGDEYTEEIVSFLKTKEPIHLVTADGSFSCLDDPAEQELKTSELQLIEMLIAVRSLSIGGNFVLKQFTSFECITICKMYFLNCVFEKVHVFKPFTSKAGNSEVYIVCLNYFGSHICQSHLFQLFEKTGLAKNKALFPLSDIPESFITQITACSEYFTTLQKEAIEENLKLYQSVSSTYNEALNDIKQKCAEYYIKKCGIIPDNNYISAQLFSSKKQIKTSFHDAHNRNSKSLYYQIVGETFENLTKLKSMTWEETISDVRKRLETCFPISHKRKKRNLEWHPVWKDIKSRMKSKHYEYWVSTGKRVKIIENSKFCNPMLIYLWNQIAHNTQVKGENCDAKSFCYWDLEEIMFLLKKDEIENFIKVVPKSNSYNDDALCLQLTKHFDNFVMIHPSEENIVENLSGSSLFYINTTHWNNSLHQESIIKHQLIFVLMNVIKILNDGDSLIICIQSLLMRFTVGLLFILLSLFEKFFCLLPKSEAPALCGQLWLFKNFQKPEWLDRLLNYLNMVLNFNLPESKEVLQIVPMKALCGGSFYEYLLSVNNDHMLQRLRSLTVNEKT